MFVLLQFAPVGFCGSLVAMAFPQGSVSQFDPTLHTRPDKVTFTPHWNYSAIGENA